MRTNFALLTLVSALMLHTEIARAEDTSDFSVAGELGDDAYSMLFSHQVGTTIGGGGLNDDLQPLFEKLIATVTGGESLVKAISEVTKEPATSVVYVPIGNWKATLKSPPKDKFLVSIEASGSAIGSPITFGYTLWFQKPIDVDIAQAIAKRFDQAIAPDVKKISQQFFTENFDAAMTKAREAKDQAANVVGSLENERIQAQQSSYQELPADKIADNLADLQRQQLALNLSLVGSDARKEAIETQLKIAEVRLKEQAQRAAKEAAADDSVDAITKLIALREKSLETMQDRQKAGAVSQSELDEARARLLETKIQLLNFQSKKIPQPRTDQLDTLNAELTRLAIDSSEARARLDYLEKARQDILAKTDRRMRVDERVKQINERLPPAKAKLRDTEHRVTELERAKSFFKPLTLRYQ